MRSYYEESLFKVVEVRDNVPVYKIQNVMKPRDVRVVHRNKLLKVEELPLDTFQEKDNSNKEKQKRIGKKAHQKDNAVVVENPAEEEHLESDSEEEAILVVEQRDMVEDLDEEEQVAEEEEDIVTEVYEEEDSFASTTAYEEDDAASWTHMSDAVGSDHDHVSEDGEEPVVSETDVDDVDSVAEPDESDTSSNSSPELVRRTSRTAVPRKIFTYNKLGANPVSEAIT
jgi:hypothetical protein